MSNTKWPRRACDLLEKGAKPYQTIRNPPCSWDLFTSAFISGKYDWGAVTLMDVEPAKKKKKKAKHLSWPLSSQIWKPYGTVKKEGRESPPRITPRRWSQLQVSGKKSQETKYHCCLLGQGLIWLSLWSITSLPCMVLPPSWITLTLIFLSSVTSVPPTIYI